MPCSGCHGEGEGAFEGIIPNFQRRFKETDSVAVRDELARYQAAKPCTQCEGSRLRRESRHVFMQHACTAPPGVDAAGGDGVGDGVGDGGAKVAAQAGADALTQGVKGKPIYEVEHATLAAALAYFEGLKLVGAKGEIAERIVREIRSRLRFLNDVGLNYLSLDRGADTLSGGEAQRIRLASQIGSGLSGVMYVLDEPSIGLHQRDNERLIGTLKHLRDLGNSVLVVEHDEDMIRAADHVVDMGPGAGVHGGRVMAQGTPQEVADNPESLTGKYLSNVLRIEVPKRRRAATGFGSAPFRP